MSDIPKRCSNWDSEPGNLIPRRVGRGFRGSIFVKGKNFGNWFCLPIALFRYRLALKPFCKDPPINTLVLFSRRHFIPENAYRVPAHDHRTVIILIAKVIIELQLGGEISKNI
jgi:hypothetical protein